MPAEFHPLGRKLPSQFLRNLTLEIQYLSYSTKCCSKVTDKRLLSCNFLGIALSNTQCIPNILSLCLLSSCCCLYHCLCRCYQLGPAFWSDNCCFVPSNMLCMVMDMVDICFLSPQAQTLRHISSTSTQAQRMNFHGTTHQSVFYCW
jgi:hypothetical protein